MPLTRLLLALFCTALIAPAWADEIRVGVLGFRGSEAAVRDWSPTIDYLNVTLQEHRFTLVPLELAELDAQVGADEVQFVLTNPGHYVELEARHGVSRIATLESRITEDPRFAIGSAVVVRREREDLQTLGDLKGRTLLAIEADAFGGFQIAWYALRRAGVEPHDDVEVRFVGFPMDRIAERVRDGEADAGVLRSCLLEQMVAEGRLAAGALRVLAPRSHYGFDCSASTELYPDWPLAKTRHAPPAIAKRVAEALYAMPPEHPAAAAGGYAGWTIPVDYQPVHELFRELGIGPYADNEPPTLEELLAAYWPWLAAAVAAFLWGTWHVARVEQQVRLRTLELSAANTRLKAALHDQALAEERARQHEAELAHVARVVTVSELAAGLAHEINQPLAAIANYAEGCRVRLREASAPDDLVQVVSEIENQASRAGAIVHRLRGFLRKEPVGVAPFDLDEAVAEALSLFLPEARRKGVAVRSRLGASGAHVCGEAIQIEQVVLNLLRNALEAFEPSPARREIELRTRLSPGEARVSVRDHGQGISEEVRRHLFEPFFTTKSRGMGLGLSISRSIVESHGGRVLVENAEGGGTDVSFLLPICDPADAS